MSELAWLTLAEAGRRIRERALSPVEYVTALLDRIHAHDARLHAVLHLAADRALDEARTAERECAHGRWRGPLHGIPFALKDIIDAEGLPTTAHSALLRDHVAPRDATVTARLRAAGGVLMAKLAAHEFALGGPSFDLPWPPARNPWNPDCFTGGSSSGSGAGVAAGFFPAALGTDTGGSVRHPATHCGIVGMKATYGAVSRAGVLPLSWSLDHVGPMTRTVEDNALLLNAIAGPDASDPASAGVGGEDYARDLHRGIEGLRIGVIRHFHSRDLDADREVSAAIESALGVLGGLGAQVHEVETAPLAEFAAVNRILLYAEAYTIHARWLRERPRDFAQRTRSRMLVGAFLSARDYLQAQRWRRRLARHFERTLGGLDAVVHVSSHEPPARLDHTAAIDARAERQARTVANVTGHPSLSIPIGFTDGGLPVGMLIAGHPFAEAMLYRIGHAYEQAAGWTSRHPPLDDASPPV